MSFFFAARRRGVPVLAMILLGSFVTVTRAMDQPLTLQAAVAQGVQKAPLLTARRADVEAMREDAVRAGRLPDPALTVGVANYPVTAPGAFSLRSDSMTMRTIGIMQAIPSHATRDAQRALADAKVVAADAERVATRQSVQERVADAWIAVWAAEQRRTLLQALQDESALAVRTAQARLRGGDGSATDALAARAEAASLDNRLASADAAVDAARAGLARWLGDGTVALAAAPDFGQLPVAPRHLEASIDRQAPMQVWAAREQVAQAALDEARASKHPDWSVSLEYGHRAPFLSDMVTLQVGVSLPLFTRNRQDRDVSARQAQWDAVQADHDDARRAQREQVAQTLAIWRGWNRQIDNDRKRLLPLDRDRARTVLAGYAGGGALQPWLDARRDEIELRLRYADALAERAKVWAALAYLLPTSEDAP